MPCINVFLYLDKDKYNFFELVNEYFESNEGLKNFASCLAGNALELNEKIYTKLLLVSENIIEKPVLSYDMQDNECIRFSTALWDQDDNFVDLLDLSIVEEFIVELFSYDWFDDIGSNPEGIRYKYNKRVIAEEYFNPAYKGCEGITEFVEFCKNKKNKEIQRFLFKGVELPELVIFDVCEDAVTRGDSEVLRTLLNSKYIVDTINCLSGEFSKNPLIQCVETENSDALELLLTLNISINIKNNDGCTALSESMYKKYSLWFDKLISLGAEICLDNGYYPEVFNCVYDISTLMEVENKILFEQSRLKILKYYLDSGLDINIREKTCLDRYDDINTDELATYGDTLLMESSASGAEKIVNFLIDNGASINLVNEDKEMTALDCAYEMDEYSSGYRSDLEEIKNIKCRIINMLKDSGAKTYEELQLEKA